MNSADHEQPIDPSAGIAALMAGIRARPPFAAFLEVVRGRSAAVYAVGGAVRDSLLGRAWHDLDVAMAPGAVAPLAAALADQTGGTIVPLDDALPTLRVAGRAEDDHWEVDLSGFRGGSIEEDLVARDLTVNALAVLILPLAEGAPAALVDPSGGLGDLRRGVARLPSPDVLAADPLRALRVHRFAATLELTIDPATRAAVRAHAASLAGVASERVTGELMTLLAAPRSGARLAELREDGILETLFPELSTMAGCEQNTFHHLDVLDHTLAACRELDAIRAAPERFFGAHGEGVRAYLASDRRAALVTLATLLHDVAKPATRFRDERGIHFYRHESVGAGMAEGIAERLRLAARDRERLVRWIADHLVLKDLILLHRDGRLPDRTVRRLLRRAGDELIGLLALVLADTRATRGPDFPADGERLLLEVVDRLLGEREKQLLDPAHAAPLLRGRDLIEHFGLEPGVALGRILAALEDARLDGEVCDREGALAWVQEWLERRAGPSGGALE